jgi:hypothetical protein
MAYDRDSLRGYLALVHTINYGPSLRQALPGQRISRPAA